MIRVLIAEDHGVVRAGIERLLATVDDIDVVACAGDGRGAVELTARHAPDVVLMDLSMPVMDGAAATRRIRAEHPDVHVVILTSFSDREQILGALDAGAVGYLLKDADPAELIAGVRAAGRGESPLAPKAASALLRARHSGRPEVDLTAREQEVLALVARGLPNKLIARELGISEKTVKTHLTRAFQEIGVTDRTQAALWARERRIGS